MQGPFTVEQRVGLVWVPLRTYSSYPHAVGLARDYSGDGRRMRVTDASGKPLWDSILPRRGVPQELRRKGRR